MACGPMYSTLAGTFTPLPAPYEKNAPSSNACKPSLRCTALIFAAENALLPTKRTESGKTIVSQALSLNALSPM